MKSASKDTQAANRDPKGTVPAYTAAVAGIMAISEKFRRPAAHAVIRRLTEFVDTLPDPNAIPEVKAPEVTIEGLMQQMAALLQQQNGASANGVKKPAKTPVLSPTKAVPKTGTKRRGRPAGSKNKPRFPAAVYQPEAEEQVHALTVESVTD